MSGLMRVSIDGGLWSQIVLRANESEDAFLRQLIEQAVAGGRFEDSADLRASRRFVPGAQSEPEAGAR